MLIAFLVWVIASLTRGILASTFHVSGLFGSHIWFLAPDAMFFLYVLYFLLVQEKKRLTLPVIGFLVAFLGSLLWDYQSGFYFLKFLFPTILFLAMHEGALRAVRFKDVARFGLFFLPPTLLISALQHRPQITKPSQKVRTPFIQAGIVGVVIGLIMMLILAGLDPSFAKFLRITEWFNMFKSTLGSALYYGFTFLWFFWVPARATFAPKQEFHSLPRLLQAAVMLIFAVIIGYTVYDAYILLRAFHLMALTFESMGKNTQLSFIELVVLGGMWLFSVAFVMSHIKSQPKESGKSYAVITTLLLASLVWLLPPVYNILRVLLSVYIPAFGLTAMRLFGVYTTIAFVVALAIAVAYTFANTRRIFSNTVVWFFVVLCLLSFALPNNIMLYQWHFDAYKQHKEIDFSYVRHLKLEKWGWLFFSQLNPTERKQDNLWGLLLSQRVGDTKRQASYRDAISTGIEEDTARMQSLIENQEFATVMQEYGPKGWWVYSGKKIDGLTLHVRREGVSPQSISIDTDNFGYNSYRSQKQTIWVSYAYKGSATTLSTMLTIDNDPSKTHYVTVDDVYGNDLAPFWAHNRSLLAQPCTYSMAGDNSYNQVSDEQLVTRYLLVKPSCNAYNY